MPHGDFEKHDAKVLHNSLIHNTPLCTTNEKMRKKQRKSGEKQQKTAIKTIFAVFEGGFLTFFNSIKCVCVKKEGGLLNVG
jgi:hypothetical protein